MQVSLTRLKSGTHLVPQMRLVYRESMISWISKQAVESSEGFTVQSLSRFLIRYSEGNQFIEIEVEDGFRAGRPIVSMREQNPFQNWPGTSVVPTEVQRKRLANFIAAMEFQGIGVE